MQGIVVHYNEEKGYGFIEVEEQEDDIFIHHSKITNASELSQGQSVEFQLKKTSKEHQ
jgi:cold shock CspA family protein